MSQHDDSTLDEHDRLRVLQDEEIANVSGGDDDDDDDDDDDNPDEPGEPTDPEEPTDPGPHRY